MISIEELLQAMPLIILGTSILIALLIDMFLPKSKNLLAWFSIVALLATSYFSLFTMDSKGLIFSNMISNSSRVHLLYFVLNFASALVLLLSVDYIKKIEVHYGEFYVLVLSAVLGMMLIAAARDLVIVFIGLEQMSICFYVLAGFRRKESKSNESALKYFLLGSFATGFIVYGMALIYGAAVSFNINDILVNISALSSNPIFLVGALLFIIGFTFKIAAVPFHMWAPDVYQGAPTPITAFMATAGKVAAFAALITFLAPFMHADSATAGVFTPFLSVLAVLSMLYGAVVAITQDDVKRMLAYSSIAHAGYMLIGLATLTFSGANSVVFYLIAYTFMNIGAFGIISLLENKEGAFLNFKDYAGLGSRNPVQAALLSVFLFALAGLPPFAGFFAKYFVFIAAVKSNMVWLALFGVISSIISAYFYLRLIVIMYFQKSETDEPAIPVSNLSMLGVLISLLLFLSMSIFPGRFEGLISSFVSFTF